MKYGQLGDLKRDLTLIELFQPFLMVMRNKLTGELYLFLAEDSEESLFLATKISKTDLISFLNGEKPMDVFFRESDSLFFIRWNNDEGKWESEGVSNTTLLDSQLPNRGEFYEFSEEKQILYRDSLAGINKTDVESVTMSLGSGKTTRKEISFVKMGYFFKNIGKSLTYLNSAVFL